MSSLLFHFFLLINVSENTNHFHVRTKFICHLQPWLAYRYKNSSKVNKNTRRIHLLMFGSIVVTCFCPQHHCEFKIKGQRANALYCLLIITEHLLPWVALSWPTGDMAESDRHHSVNISLSGQLSYEELTVLIFH